MQRIRCRIMPAAILAVLLLPAAAAAEDAAEGEPLFKTEELDQMLAPIALHPDALLSQMLMASTYPTDVAEAVEWSAAHPDVDGDEAVEMVEGQAWDPSVKSLVAFPQVLAMMGERPDWVKDVGDAFLAEPERVMDRIQYMRRKSKEAGYLESNEWQTVSEEDPATEDAAPQPQTQTSPSTTVVVEQQPQTIVIQQTNPQVVYVPAYDPMVVYGVWWWPVFRPWFWRPIGWGFGAALWRGVGFGVGIGISNALWGGFHWGRRDININVNRFNNIHVSNRINSRDRNVGWKHNPDRRRDVAYRDQRSRDRFDGERRKANQRDRADTLDRVGQRDRSGDRNDFRGRDSQRDAAQRAMRDRGIDPAEGRDRLRNDPGTRDRAKLAARDMDRGKRNRAQAQQRELSRSREQARRQGRDNALRGVSRSSGHRQSVNRGKSSRSSSRGSMGRGRQGGGRRR
jgi:hypothetical protein